MSSILVDVISFVVVIGILVTFHEFGHFWVARRCGVRVLKFSIGFGKPIYSWVDKDETEYVLAMIPLGGYVKMLDERNEPVADEDLPFSFNQKPLASRFAIVSAGPIFNFLLAIVLYWAVFVIGSEGLIPVIDSVRSDSVAQLAGVQPGDRIVAIDEEKTQTWEVAGMAFISAVLEGKKQLQVEVVDADDRPTIRVFNLEGVSAELSRGGVVRQLGLEPKLQQWPAVIDKLVAGEAAANAGLLPGDRVLVADGEPVNDWRDWVGHVQKKPGQAMQLSVLRDGAELDLVLVPGIKTHETRSYGYVGAQAVPPPPIPDEMRMHVQYSFLSAWVRSVSETWRISHLTLRMLGKMLIGEASVKNISGPITIAQYAGRSASIGLVQFLTFMAVVSISLGVLNLLPIPVLDGGHLMYYLVEMVKGSPVSEKTQLIGQQMGLVILGLLMVLAFYNDVMRLL